MKTPCPREVQGLFAGCSGGPQHAGETWLEDEAITYPSGAMIRRAYCRCEDGALRVVVCGIPDTFFSIPARARIKGKSVTGFITHRDEEFRFIAHKEEA
jgi:hypothetical protein